MIFNSLDFIIFFFVLLFLIFTSSKITDKIQVQNIILLTASYYFYAKFSPVFLFLLLYVTILNFSTGLILNKLSGIYRKSCMAINIILTLLPLLFYKYAGFILDNINTIFNTDICPNLDHIALPVGISFFTFQTLSYTIDIYRQKITPTNNFINVALFVSFFPTILSGPIERARNMIPQLEKTRFIDMRCVMSGLMLYVWGVFKKVVIADRLSSYIDWAYSNTQYASGSTLAFAAILYSFQIYCDFSGYSDMAIGIARALGFKIMKNFDYPYFAHNIKTFWRRWHISLTSWFTEYVYFSLGGSRVKSRLRWIFNITTIFLLSGIWHGASWNFIIWGLLHAIFYLIEFKVGLQNKNLDDSWRFPRVIAVFLLITFAWIFFRIDDIGTVMLVLNKIITEPFGELSLGASAFATIMSIGMLIIMLFIDILLYTKKLDMYDIDQIFSIKNMILLIILLLCISMFGVSSNSFVYFQF